MIVSRSGRWVYFGAPKTGCYCLNAVLVRPPFDGEANGHFHDMAAFDPAAWPGYRVWGVHRDPYERVVSLYHHGLAEWKAAGDRRGEGYSFAGFVREIGSSTDLGPFFTQTISDAFRRLLGRVEFLPLADLDAELLRRGIAPCPVALPVLNCRGHGPAAAHYDPETRAIVRRLYAEDFERFGYPSH